MRLLPFPVHGWVERVVGPILIALPFALGFRASARVFYLAMGAVVVVVGLLSRYRADASRPAREAPEDAARPAARASR